VVKGKRKHKKMTKQLFNIPIKNTPQQPGKLTPQQEQYQLYAKLIALGVFGIIAFPIILKIYMKGPYTSLIIGAYWVIIIAVGLFFSGMFIKKQLNKKQNNGKPKT